MGLFNNGETKEEKAERKEAQMLHKYGMDNLGNIEDVESVKKIVQELAGSGLFEVGMALGGANDKELLKQQVYYQRAMIEQNFIIIRQLDRLNKKLEK
jgi:hypothetical protein